MWIERDRAMTDDACSQEIVKNNGFGVFRRERMHCGFVTVLGRGTKGFILN